MSVPTFVVGTGRCGSTMLSNMLREHPLVLSLSEFFGFLGLYGNRMFEAFSPEVMSSGRFWEFVSTINALSRFSYRHGVTCPEQLYPVDNATSRYSSETGVPAILQTTLPHLTEDHDALYDTLRQEVNRWPEATIGEHYRHLFGWLAKHFGKQLWGERSGTSLRIAEQLTKAFPEAKFVHVTRDGRDAAISMQGHSLFRLGLVMTALEERLGVDPLESLDRTHIDQVPAELRPFLPENFDATAFQAFRFPLLQCGEYWTWQIDTGLKALSALPTDQLLILRYEDILSDPKRQLDTFAAFLGEEFVDEDWSASRAATVRRPKSTWRDLPEEEAGALTEACRPGFELLAAAGVDYDI